MFKLTRDKAYLKKKNSSNYFLCWGDRFKNIKIRRNLSMNQIIFLTIHFMRRPSDSMTNITRVRLKRLGLSMRIGNISFTFFFTRTGNVIDVSGVLLHFSTVIAR